jgi:hypothetical protein
MTKAIRTLLVGLSLLLAAACTKTDLNTIAIKGEWEVQKIETVENGKIIDTYYPRTEEGPNFYNFEDNGVFFFTIEYNKGGHTQSSGRWLVDGDTLILSIGNNRDVYHIEHAGLLELRLSIPYTEGGRTLVDYLTLKK